MHLLYCDETNFERRKGDFFVYGGIAINGKRAGDLADEIKSIRKELRVPRDYVLKFNPGPDGFSHEDFVKLKRRVIKAAVQAECTLLVNLVLHDISSSSADARRFGINTLCFHFDCYLNRVEDQGIVLIDRFEDREIDAQLRERLAVGLTGKLPYSDEMKIKNILGYHYAAIGQSHFCSLVDVLLGSLRFAINTFTRRNENHMDSATKILSQLSPLFYHGKAEKVHEISLWFSPKEIRKPALREQYINLQRFLRGTGIDASQAL